MKVVGRHHFRNPQRGPIAVVGQFENTLQEQSSGAGEDAILVFMEARRFVVHFQDLACWHEEGPEERFKRLSQEWAEQTKHLSSVTAIATHPAYQQIIGLGREALPLIFERLCEQPDHWFWALSAITGVDPVPPDDRGDINAMARVWVDWGKEQGWTK